LDDLYQPVFGGSVAAVGVWMVALYQFLKPRFDLL
jgi:hypothetical protein